MRDSRRGIGIYEKYNYSIYTKATATCTITYYVRGEKLLVHVWLEKRISKWSRWESRSTSIFYHCKSRKVYTTLFLGIICMIRKGVFILSWRITADREILFFVCHLLDQTLYFKYLLLDRTMYNSLRTALRETLFLAHCWWKNMKLKWGEGDNIFSRCVVEETCRDMSFCGTVGCMPTVPPNLVMAHRRKNTLQHT